MRQRFALVFNDTAGTIRPLLLDRVLTVLRATGAVVQPVQAASAVEASAKVRALALTGEVEAVIAAGGDGTVRAVAVGLADTALPVGYIPLGTGNVLKYEMGLGSRAEVIAGTLLHGAILEARCGLVNGAPFFLMAGAGFDARIVAGLAQAAKRVMGRAAYTFPATQAFAGKPPRFQVEADGEAYEASWVIVSNAMHYGGSFVLTRDTQLGVDGLVAVIVTGDTRRAMLSAGLALAAGRLGDAQRCPKGVIVRRVHRVHITARRPVHIQVDGDEAGMSPAEILASGPQVRFIVPPAYVAALTKRHANRLASVL